MLAYMRHPPSNSFSTQAGVFAARLTNIEIMDSYLVQLTVQSGKKTFSPFY